MMEEEIMGKQEHIRQLHEKLNDIFMELHSIEVMDERSRDAKQAAILSLISMRKTMENMGLHHAPLKGDPS
jgi:hypothetical protein